MRINPLPKIDKVFFHILKEAQRRDTMQKNDEIVEPLAAMVVKIPMKTSVFHVPPKNKAFSVME